MGGQSSSVQKTDIVTQSLTNIMVKTSQSCSSTSANSQNIKVGKIIASGKCKVNVGNIRQDLKVVNNLGCIQEVKTDTDLRNDIAREIKQQAEAKVEGITTNHSQSVNVNNIITEIATNIDIESLSSCTNEVYNSQVLEQQGIVCSGEAEVTLDDMVQTLMSKQITKCIQAQENIAKLASDLNNTIDQAAKSVSVGANFGSLGSLTSLGLGFMSPLITLIALVMSSLGLSLIPLLMSGNEEIELAPIGDGTGPENLPK